MARITLASHLTSLRGTLGDIVYCRRYGRAYARVHVRPANPDTEGQRAVRRAFGDAVRSWQALPREDKERWNRRAAGLPMSGYNLYISRSMRDTLPAYLPSRANREADGGHLRHRGQASPSVPAPYPFNTLFHPPCSCPPACPAAL
jgi:hypothetical protein